MTQSNDMDYQRLILRRQYMVSPIEIKLNPYFISRKLTKDTYLNYHADLNFTYFKKGSSELILLGDMFDPFSNETNLGILENSFSDNFDDFILKTNVYGGRFVIIYIFNQKQIKLFNDPATHRKVFWAKNDNGLWCCSEIKTLAIQLKLEKDDLSETKEFFSSREFKEKAACGILSTTEYREIMQLKPNFYLDYNKQVTKRFWPDKAIQPLSLYEGARKSAYLLKGFISNAAKRYKLMIPITSGLDSRILLAASKDISKNIYYYIIDNPHEKIKKTDLIIPCKLLKKLGLDFHIIRAADCTSTKFKKIYYQNCEYAIDNRISPIYDVYFMRFANYYNVSGSFSEVAREGFDTIKDNPDGKTFARLYNYRNQYAINQYEQWQQENRVIAAKYNINLTDLFYWEERIATWATYYQSNKDIAQEEFWPFNSRFLIETMWSVNRKYRDRFFARFHYEIIKVLWNETLMFPINPSFRNVLGKMLKRLGLFRIIISFDSIRSKYG